jgi:putative FmdB family regulatory protein
MPLYEYQCTECGKKTEVLQRYADAPLAACPACSGPVKKLISSPAFQFKGTGWYVTDYARKGGAGGTGETAGGAAGAGDGGSVSKPEAKSGSQSESHSEKSEARSEKSESRSEKSEARSERSDARSESKADSKADSKTDARSGATGAAKSVAGTGGGGS